MRRLYFLSIILFTLLGLAETPNAAAVKLALDKARPISELDKNYSSYARRQTLLQIKGALIHQDKAANNWAFIEDSSGTVLLDFTSVTPDIRLPRKKIGSTLIVEGRISLDETVLNGYVLIPSAYLLAE